MKEHEQEQMSMFENLSEEEKADIEDKELIRAREQVRLMKELVDSPAFKYLVTSLQVQIKERYESLIAPPGGFDGLVQNSYAAGEIAGLKLALDYPRILVDYAEGQIAVQKANDEERENG